VALLSSDALAAVLYSDQMDNGAGWGINNDATDSSATFGYDYSADGIPEAPNSQGGDTATSGVKLEANNGDFTEAAAYISIFPMGQNFTGDYKLEFDMWRNYSTLDREQEGGKGTTEFGGGGIGYDNVAADIGSGAQIVTTNEGGSGSDYRVFKDGFFLPNEAMHTGSRNATGSQQYIDLFPAGSGIPPASQGQTGVPNENRDGTPGFQWATFRISAIGDIVRTSMINKDGDLLRIAQYDKTDTSDGSTGVGTDGNVMVFYSDWFSSISPHPGQTFGIVDNVVVTSIPEPASLLMLGMGGLGLLVTRRRK